MYQVLESIGHASLTSIAHASLTSIVVGRRLGSSTISLLCRDVDHDIAKSPRGVDSHSSTGLQQANVDYAVSDPDATEANLLQHIRL